MEVCSCLMKSDMHIVSLLNMYCNRDVCCICIYIYIDLYIHEIYIYIYIYLSYHIGNENMVSYR